MSLSYLNICPARGRGHLYLKVDTILVTKKKKNQIIRVVFFRTRQCTRLHRLGVQKRGKLKKKMVRFWSDKFWKGHDGQIK